MTGQYLGSSLQQRVQTLELITRACQEDLERCVVLARTGEPHALISDLRDAVLTALGEISEKVARRTIHPDLPLRLSITDHPVEWPPESERERQRVGFLATTGDPLHWGHLLLALRAIADYDLHTVVCQVLGDHPHKRERKQPKEHRHAIARHALKYFYPLLRYTSLGFENMKVGEENAAEFLLLNYDHPIDLYFIGAGDVMSAAASNLTACRQLLSVLELENKKAPALRGLFFVGSLADGAVAEFMAKYPFIEWITRGYKPLPKVKGQRLSATLFRSDVSLPILPTNAAQYISEHGLYRSAQEYENHHPPSEPLCPTVLVAYLTPEYYTLLEREFSDLREVGDLIPHGPVVKNGRLGGHPVSLLRGFGKETTVLPLVRRGEVRLVFALGLCGALQSKLRTGDVIVPTCAIRGDGITGYWQDPRIPALPDPLLHHGLLRALGPDNVATGPVYTTASLARERQVLQEVANQGILGVEMELALHLTLGQLHAKRTAAAYVVSDQVALGQEILIEGLPEETGVLEGLRRALGALQSVLSST